MFEMQVRPVLKAVLVLFVSVRSVCALRVKVDEDEARMDTTLDVSPGKRKFLRLHIRALSGIVLYECN